MIFGLIPTFVSSIVMVGILHKLHTNSSPLIQYRPHKESEVFKEMGQELTANQLCWGVRAPGKTIAIQPIHHFKKDFNRFRLHQMCSFLWV